MQNKELVNYISRGRGAGTSDERLRSALLAAGWLDVEIDEAMAEAGSHVSIKTIDVKHSDLVPAKVVMVNRHQHLALIIVLSLVGLFLFIVLLVVGYKFYQTNASPEKISKRISQSLSDVEGVEYSGRLVADISVKQLVGHNGTSSVILPETFGVASSTYKFNFNGLASLPRGGESRLFLDGKWQNNSAGQNFALDFSSKLIDEVLYLNIAHLATNQLVDLSEISDRWLSISPAELVVLGFEGNFSQVNSQKLSFLRQNLAKNSLVTIGQKVDKSGEVYEFSMSIDQVEQILSGLIAIAGGESLVGGNHWLDAANWHNVRGEITLDRSSLPKKIHLLADFKTSNEVGEEIYGPIDLELVFADFSKQEIKAPKEAVSLVKILETVDSKLLK